MTRRNPVLSILIRLLALGTVALVLLVGGIVAIAWNTTPVDTVGAVVFDTELVIPPLAESSVDANGRRTFELTAQEGRTSIGGDQVRTWGFNGDYLGPTLRAERGEKVAVRVSNGLDEPTTVHWHGMHLPAAMDGGPHQMVAAGDQWTAEWTIDQPAATLWYHPHPHGQTMDHVSRGLAGMFIVDDPAEDVLGLPSEYGVNDLPVIVTDPTVRRGEVSTSSERGDGVLVNGTQGPYVEVTD